MKYMDLRNVNCLFFHEISEHGTASKTEYSHFLDKQGYAIYKPHGLQFWECSKIAKPLTCPQKWKFQSMCEFCSIAQELSACILDICKRLRCRTEQAHNSSSMTAQKSWLELYKITRKSQVSSVKLLPGTVCVSGFPVHLHKHHFHQFISHVAVTTPGQNHV